MADLYSDAVGLRTVTRGGTIAFTTGDTVDMSPLLALLVGAELGAVCGECSFAWPILREGGEGVGMGDIMVPAEPGPDDWYCCE